MGEMWFEQQERYELQPSCPYCRYEVSGLHECGIARVMRPKRPLRTKPSDTAPISPVDKDAAIETGTEASTDIDPRSDIDGSSVYGLSRVESKASETVYCG